MLYKCRTFYQKAVTIRREKKNYSDFLICILKNWIFQISVKEWFFVRIIARDDSNKKNSSAIATALQQDAIHIQHIRLTAAQFSLIYRNSESLSLRKVYRGARRTCRRFFMRDEQASVSSSASNRTSPHHLFALAVKPPFGQIKFGPFRQNHSAIMRNP